LLGFQPLTLWQLAQLAVVGICAAIFPVAVLPLWQLAQFVEALNKPWSGLDAVQLAVVL
jgi:hypothetical protein